MQGKYSQSIADKFEVVTVKTMEEIEDIRPIWEDMQKKEPYPVINADIDRFITVVQASNHVLEPYVMLFKKQERPLAMIIGHLKRQPFEIKFGHSVLLKPRLNTLSITYGGIIGQPSKDICVLLIGELWKMLRERKFDVVRFNQLKIESPVYQFVRKMPGILCRSHFPQIENHWCVTIPENMDDFYHHCSPKTKRNLRRAMRKLKKDFPGKVEVITYRQENKLDEAIKAACEISRKTYQYAFGVGFRDTPLTRTVLTTAARREWLKFSILYIDKVPCAFQYGLDYGKRCFLEAVGYAPQWQRHSVGTALFVDILEGLCGNSEIEFIDYGFFDYKYKTNYCDKKWPEASVYIFAPRFLPVVVNLTRTFVLGCSNLLKYLIAKIGLFEFVKKYRRKIVEKRNRKAQAKLKLAASKNQGHNT